MTGIISALRDNPLLLLFLVAAIGYPIGRIKVGGASLGVAAVLFVGLAFGALDPQLALPEVIYQLGLVVFVYTIGLASGSVFFASLGQKGLRYNFLVIGGLLFAGLVAVGAHFFLGLDAAYAAGTYAGSLTNTPALAGVVERIQAVAPPDVRSEMLNQPVVAYSLTYPIGVMGMILTIFALQKIWKIDYAAEARRAPEYSSANEPLHVRTICVQNEVGVPVSELISRNQWNVVFGRYQSNGSLGVATGQTRFKPGDLVTLIGSRAALDEVGQALGEECDEHLEFNLSQYDRKRFFVSSNQAVGRRLRDLDLIGRYQSLVTRIRRGDSEMLPQGETVLAPGDQVLVIVPRDQVDNLSELFGNSYRLASEVDILTFSLGLALGLLLGLLPIPLPGGLTLRLGLAGGPLIVALILGAVGRTGPLVWMLPYGANLTLRQVGLILFLAGIGTRAGYSFFSTLVEGTGGVIFLSGILITCLTTLVTMWVGYKLMKIPMGILIGILASLQTQPAVLSFDLDQSKDDMPNIGYATVYPVAMILKIVLAQVLLILLL